ncbi:MAG: hypothetical protein ACM3ZF_14035 [Mycobacterium leprae]
MDLAHAGQTGSLTLDTATVTAVMALGVFHGLNPGMGWLFAVSFGLQERSRSALLRSLIPIAAGHELSVLPIAVAIVVFASEVTRAVAVAVFATGLVAFGVYLLLRKRHLRWVGMRLTRWQLAWWSFLMSTATGAGLMLASVLLNRGHSAADQLLTSALQSQVTTAALAALLHAVAMLTTSGAVAVLVYDVVGLRILRTAWVNLDKIWAVAFIGAGVFMWFG